MSIEVGQKVKDPDGEVGVVMKIDPDGTFEVAFESGRVTRGKVPKVETAEEKRRRENIEAGRHPLFISIDEMPSRGDWYIR